MTLPELSHTVIHSLNGVLRNFLREAPMLSFLV